MADSNKIRSDCKPAKPYPDFPLFTHANGKWAKKIRGRLYYFGRWDDPDGALQEYKGKREALYSGRVPRPTTNDITIRYLVNAFLTAKKSRVDSGELTHRSWTDYYTSCGRITGFFGLDRKVNDIGPADFEQFRSKLAKKWGPTTLGNEIRRLRVIFNYAFKIDLVDRPVKFGEFVPPSKKVMRLERAKNGIKMFESAEIRSLLEKANPTMRAMIFLGVNAGLGNMDVATLTQDKLDLKKGWLNFPRPKTGIPRCCPLWNETIDAVQEAIQDRPAPRDPEHAKQVFLTKYGQPWAKTVGRANPISTEFKKLLIELKLYRRGLSFYALRHTFETVAGDSRDQVAVDHIMGHADSSMAGMYRERISDERLKAVVDHVHKWLFAG
ncbi:MAG: tyrosine-type recombinase/integrase [Thermoguttaceae bacterium]